ncbi:MAG TPA: PHP domain-containing protein [Candidatus Acidoferrales bacterium]|nr:PHP domain-containing protein [Candidatus Acidoferrales bacterium]
MMRERGVSVFSVTDHDSLGAYPWLRDAIAPGSRLVVGIEINTTYEGNEVHVLGYGLPLDDPAFNAVIEENRQARDVRARKMVDRLRSGGYPITFEDVLEQAIPGAPLGRPHVAKALIKAGIATSVADAFESFLAPQRLGYVPSLYITPHRAVEVISRAGGVSALAHPGRLKDLKLIDELAEAGMVGLEVFYPRHDPAQVALFRTKARDHGLVMTAGADFHDPRYNLHGVGMDVDEADIRPFLDLVL